MSARNPWNHACIMMALLAGIYLCTMSFSSDQSAEAGVRPKFSKPWLKKSTTSRPIPSFRSKPAPVESSEEASADAAVDADSEPKPATESLPESVSEPDKQPQAESGSIDVPTPATSNVMQELNELYRKNGQTAPSMNQIEMPLPVPETPVKSQPDASQPVKKKSESLFSKLLSNLSGTSRRRTFEDPEKAPVFNRQNAEKLGISLAKPEPQPLEIPEETKPVEIVMPSEPEVGTKVVEESGSSNLEPSFDFELPLPMPMDDPATEVVEDMPVVVQQPAPTDSVEEPSEKNLVIDLPLPGIAVVETVPEPVPVQESSPEVIVEPVAPVEVAETQSTEPATTVEMPQPQPGKAEVVVQSPKLPIVEFQPPIESSPNEIDYFTKQGPNSYEEGRALVTAPDQKPSGELKSNLPLAPSVRQSPPKKMVVSTPSSSGWKDRSSAQPI